MNPIYFITGIDTDAGKTIVTGTMARYLKEKGVKVITQKLAQTGCAGLSEDILSHRALMKSELLAEDIDGLTCPYVFEFPSSPHLAARLEGKAIEASRLNAATAELQNHYECVLVEGAGGLMVPLNENLNLSDYLITCNYPIIMVTSGKLGSINHTLLTLEVCANKGLNLVGLVFNHFASTNRTITSDTLNLFRKKLLDYFPNAKMVEIPVIGEESDTPDFSEIFYPLQK
jgi:dethiobiotin synthetase